MLSCFQKNTSGLETLPLSTASFTLARLQSLAAVPVSVVQERRPLEPPGDAGRSSNPWALARLLDLESLGAFLCNLKFDNL